jgi:hypothetical protein
MGETEFFYDWTAPNVWSVIESTFESPTWQQDKVEVKKEFDKLKGSSYTARKLN